MHRNARRRTASAMGNDRAPHLRGSGVLVTGASTGIGAATATLLANRGYTVLGTVRRPEDGIALHAAGATPVLMDVTDHAGIDLARRTVLEALGPRPLIALVNNAGIAVAGPIEYLPLEEWRRVFEVNVFGLIAVTQAFLPALRRSGGRVVNISSVSGRVAIPFGAAYCASKFALEAISDSLRREAGPTGVDVVVIQPGSIRTPIWEKATSGDLSRYRDTPYEAMLPRVRDRALSGARAGLPPEAVAQAVLEALTARRPKTRVLVVRHKLRARMMRLLPDRWLDRGTERALWQR